MFDLALVIFLFLSPIILLPVIGNITALQFYQSGVIDSTNSMLQLQFFQFGIIVLYIVSLFQKKIRVLQDKWLFFFLIGCLVSVFLHPISVKVIHNIFLGFLLYKLVFEYSRNIKLILLPIVIVSVLNFIFQSLQFFNINFIYSYAGLMKNPSHLGTYQALAIPICYMFNPWLAIIPIMGLLLTKTWTAIFAVILVICLKFRKQIIGLGSMWIMFFMSCIVLFVSIFYKLMFYDLRPRLWVWFETLKSLTLAGHGFSFSKNLEHIFGHFDNPYNQYLGILFSVGIFSIPIFIWLYNSMKNRGLVFPSCLILAIIALGQSFMDFPRLSGTVIVLFGLLNIKTEV